MLKSLFTIAAVVSSLSPLCAGEIENLRSLPVGLGPLKAVAAPAPSAALGVPLRSAAAGEDLIDDILSRPTYEEQLAAEPQDKELFSDFKIKYIVKGTVSFASLPPVFKAETGRNFKVVKYPAWLKDVQRGRRLCVEAYLRQRENSDEMKISKMLPSNALDGLMPSNVMQDLQRDPYFISKGPGGYVLGNVNWNLKRGVDGALARDQYGNFVSEYQDGVKVNPSLLEEAYYVKKNTTKPVHFGDHGFLIFKFAPGGVTAADGRTNRYLAVSLDAYYKDQANMSYSPVEALKGRYLVYYSVQTGERYAANKLTGAPQSLSLYPLKLSSAQKAQLLDTALGKATDLNRGEVYRLFYNSCANAALSIVNSVLEENRKVKEGWLPEIFYRVKLTFPDAITKTLVKKGLAGKALPEITEANYSQAFAN